MIIPIHGLKYYKFEPVIINDDILLVKEHENVYDDKAIAAYNIKGEKIGYISTKSLCNAKVREKMRQEDIIGKVWSIGRNQILVELDFSINTSRI